MKNDINKDYDYDVDQMFEDLDFIFNLILKNLVKVFFILILFIVQ